MTQKLIHHTLNTGHERASPRAEVDAGAVRKCRKLLAEGQHRVPGMSGYDLAVSPAGRGVLATVYGPGPDKSLRPCVMFGVSPDDPAKSDLWAALIRQYRQMLAVLPIGRPPGGSPVVPSGAPWVSAVVIFPTPEEAAWIADFERCFAWAWLDQFSAAEESAPPADDSPPPVVARLVEYVRGTGLRGSEVAARCGVPQSMVSKLLSGNLNGITLVNAHKLLTGLGVAKADLVRILAPDGDNSKKE